MIRAVLFDLDDTLIDRRLALDAYTPRFMTAFSDRLDTDDPAQVMAELGRADRNGYNPERAEDIVHLAIWRSAPTAAEVALHWSEHFPACAVRRQGARETIAKLRDAKFRLGVVSNGGAAEQRTKLAVTSLQSAFDVIVISDEVGVKKPDPRIFALASASLGVGPEECLFVGDNPIKDVRAARDFGMSAAWFRASLVWPEGLPRAEHELESLGEVCKIVLTVTAR